MMFHCQPACLGQVASSKTAIPPDKVGFYSYDFHMINDKFEREHEPLDGANVKYIPSRVDDKYGFVDKKTGEWVIKPEYKQVYAVYADGAIVAKDSHYGVIAYDNKYMVPPYFTNLVKEGNIYHGMYYAQDQTLPQTYSSYTMNFYISEKGKVLFSARAHQQQSFTGTDSLAWFRYADTFSVFGRSGVMHKKIGFDKAKRFLGTFNNCLVYSEEGNRNTGINWYDLKGKLRYHLPVKDSRAHAVYHISDTMYALIDDEGITFVNNKGWPYPFSVSNGMVFSGMGNMYEGVLTGSDMILVEDETTKLFGYVSGKGALKIPCRSKRAGAFVHGEAPFLDAATQRVGFINTSGAVVVPPVFDADNLNPLAFGGQPFTFSEGLCLVALGPRMNQESEINTSYYYGYADRKGKVVLALPDSIIFAGNFADGLAPVVSKGGALGFINKKGKTVIPLNYSLAVQGAYPFPEIVVPRFINGYAYIKSFRGYIDSAGKEYFSGKRMMDHYDFSH